MKIFLPLQSESVLICLKCFKGEKSLGGRIKATVRNSTNLRVVRAAMPSGRYLITVKRFFAVILLALSVIAASSCSRRVENGYRTIAYVNSLLTDSLPELRTLAESNGKSSGTIVLVGDPSGCLRLSERMMVCDDFDNIDARKISDGLPDFAGETIVSILNFADTAYMNRPATKDGQTVLRELTVNGALAALKIPSRCKILIICNPILSEYGGSDVSDLFERIGCDVPVICSSDTTFSFTEACFRKMRERDAFTHNIAYPVARLYMAVLDSLDSKVSVLPFIDSLVPASYQDTVEVLAPNTYYSYDVQNQH